MSDIRIVRHRLIAHNINLASTNIYPLYRSHCTSGQNQSRKQRQIPLSSRHHKTSRTNDGRRCGEGSRPPRWIFVSSQKSSSPALFSAFLQYNRPILCAQVTGVYMPRRARPKAPSGIRGKAAGRMRGTRAPRGWQIRYIFSSFGSGSTRRIRTCPKHPTSSVFGMRFHGMKLARCARSDSHSVRALRAVNSRPCGAGLHSNGRGAAPVLICFFSGGAAACAFQFVLIHFARGQMRCLLGSMLERTRILRVASPHARGRFVSPLSRLPCL